MVSDRHGSWQEWVGKASGTVPSLIGYAAFMLLTAWICLHFQEQFVTKVRKAMLRHML